ncbi:hypothetical protein [Actinomadura soli]|uniref:hypothetical protein n=1 Tax=Actinomadura soli TaxID=2508997 RepID=UPI0014869C15|nr:hypothetical protein [Actinomadura soli]
MCDLDAGGWRLLGFEYLEGRADCTPGSQDLDAALTTLATVGGLRLPADVKVMWFEGR